MIGQSSFVKPSLRAGVLFWLLLEVIGGVVIALPDDGRRLFSLS